MINDILNELKAGSEKAKEALKREPLPIDRHSFGNSL